MRQATRNALQEFDLWARDNPDAPIAQFDLVGRKMVDRYRAFTWDSMSAGTGLPANFVTEFLASDPDDSEAEKRLKNGLEGVLAGVLFDSFLAGLKVPLFRSLIQTCRA